MKPFQILGITSLVLMSVAVKTADAQTNAADSNPSWDLHLRCDQAQCPRFVVLSKFDDAAVLDRETGLVWERTAGPDQIDWFNAQFQCNRLTVGNRKGWRLPTIQELASLLDPSVAFTGVPALPIGHPFSVASVFYWSGTSDHKSPDLAWGVIINNASPVTTNKDVPFFRWCVRGGQGVDVQ
jgi:hypothetical protein